MNYPYIIIPSKEPDRLLTCVNRILEKEPTLPRKNIVVVDDGAKTKETESALSGISWVQGEKPFVYARNTNLGIYRARKEAELGRTPNILLMNDDVLIETECGIFHLANLLFDYGAFGIISPAISNVGNSNQNDHRTSEVREEDRSLCFSCVMIRGGVFDIVGYLDERFVDYGMEDDDFSLRVRRAGWKLGIYDPVKVDHHTLESSYRGRGGGNFYPNLKRFIQKWGCDNWGQTKENSNFPQLFEELERGT